MMNGELAAPAEPLPVAVQGAAIRSPGTRGNPADRAGSRRDDRGTGSWVRYAIGLLACYAVVRAGVASVSKPFWFDEIFTWIMARQPSLAQMWSAVRRGVDSQPPLFDLVERLGSLVPPPELGLRLPSILAFGCVSLLIFMFVQRRSGGAYGLVAAASVLLSILFVTYAEEARPYSLVAASVALALVAYQRTPSVPWTAALAAALALGQALHYYMIFAVAAFAAAEAAYWVQRSRFRPWVWIAILIGGSPLALSWPQLVRFKAIYGPNFWARPTTGGLIASYGNMFQVSFFWGTAVAIACGLAVLGLPYLAGSHRARSLGGRLRVIYADPFFHENLLVFLLLATPATVFVAARMFHGGYTERYFLYAVLGLPIAIGLILPRLGRPASVLTAIVLGAAIVLQEGFFWRNEAHLRLEPPTATVEAMLRGAGNADLPVVVSDPLEFLKLSHYATGPTAQRLTWLADTAASLRYRRSDSTEKGLTLLATCAPLRVYDFRAFSSQHPSFLLYAAPDGHGAWWPKKLIADGYRLVALASRSDRVLYRVTR